LLGIYSCTGGNNAQFTDDVGNIGQTLLLQPVTIGGMLFHSLNLDTIGTRFDEIASIVVSLSKTSSLVDPEHSPTMLQDAMHRLVEILRILDQPSPTESEKPFEDNELNELGDYGINLLIDFSSLAAELELSEQSRELEDLSLPMGLWLVRHHGQLRTLEPIVNAVARLANTFHEPLQLIELYDVTQELLKGVELNAGSTHEHGQVSQPWRILLINHAIIATRSHRPGLIDEAYETLTQYLPNDAPDFFKEGMIQMDTLDYPRQVREVVEKYYNLWCLPRTLH
jgi:hypothetical protein